ncbi:hypothetical protein Tco_0265684 [Tanacetum coccineum]
MEEQVKEQAKNDAEQEREDSLEDAPFNHTYAEVFIPSIHSQPTQQSGVWVKDTTDVTIENLDEFPRIETSETTNVAEGIGSAMEEELSTPAVDKGKRVDYCCMNKPDRMPLNLTSMEPGSTPDRPLDVSDLVILDLSPQTPLDLGRCDAYGLVTSS